MKPSALDELREHIVNFYTLYCHTPIEYIECDNEIYQLLQKEISETIFNDNSLQQFRTFFGIRIIPVSNIKGIKIYYKINKNLLDYQLKI